MNLVQYRRALAVPAMTVLLMLAGGCIVVGGSDRNYRPTLGKQVQDLKTAHDSGALTDEEYNTAKASMIKDYKK